MAQVAEKQRYHVDLAGLMRTYETNYAKLNALLPVSAEVGDVRCYQAANMVYQLTRMKSQNTPQLLRYVRVMKRQCFLCRRCLSGFITMREWLKYAQAESSHALKLNMIIPMTS